MEATVIAGLTLVLPLGKLDSFRRAEKTGLSALAFRQFIHFPGEGG